MPMRNNESENSLEDPSISPQLPLKYLKNPSPKFNIKKKSLKPQCQAFRVTTQKRQTKLNMPCYENRNARLWNCFIRISYCGETMFPLFAKFKVRWIYRILHFLYPSKLDFPTFGFIKYRQNFFLFFKVRSINKDFSDHNM